MTTTVPETLVENENLKDYLARVAKARAKEAKIIEWHMGLFVATDGEVELPYQVDGTYMYVNKYKRNPETGAVDYEAIDGEATVEYLGKIAKYAVAQGYKVEKKYESDFTLEVILEDEYDSKTGHITIHYSADRGSVCTKRVVGTKVIPAYVQPERVEEVVEWDCEKISLLK